MFSILEIIEDFIDSTSPIRHIDDVLEEWRAWQKSQRVSPFDKLLNRMKQQKWYSKPNNRQKKIEYMKQYRKRSHVIAKESSRKR